MGTIFCNISQVLGITIIHSLWQGLLIYFMLRIVLTFGGQLSASKKYLMASASLLAITCWFVYTLINEIAIYNWLAVVPTKLSAMPLLANIPSGIGRFNDQTIRYYYSIEEYLPYITGVYVIGLIYNVTKLVISHKTLNRIKQNIITDLSLQHAVNKCAEILNIGKQVKIGTSKLVDVPCMAGYLKPVILLPVTLTTWLSAEEIEAIIMHELAHIKRNDYLANMIQQVITILLFFNPCAQLINRIINEERENCCDDLVVKATANPITYAKALFKLEQTRQNDQQLALAATGKKYHLLNRIERIMKTQKQIPSLRPALLATLILTISTCCIALFNPQIAQGKVSVKAIAPIIEQMLADTGKKVVKKKTNLQAKKSAHAAQRNADRDYDYSDLNDDAKMKELNAEIQKHSEAVSKYYESDEFKASTGKITELGKQIEQEYNRPEAKHLQEELADASKEFAKSNVDNSKMEALSKQLGDKGRKIGAYYSSPEFKKMNEELRKKYGIPENYYSDDRNTQDPNHKKYQEELNSRIPADIKLTQDDMQKLSKQITDHYQEPEFKARQQRVQLLGDSLSKIYTSADVREKQKQMEQLSKTISGYQNSPEIQKEQAALNESVKKLTAYIHSKEYRDRLKRQIDMSMNMGKTYDEDRPEKPEKKEKPEKPEKPERPEQPESDN